MDNIHGNSLFLLTFTIAIIDWIIKTGSIIIACQCLLFVSIIQHIVHNRNVLILTYSDDNSSQEMSERLISYRKLVGVIIFPRNNWSCSSW